jgi:hypothetical protein
MTKKPEHPSPARARQLRASGNLVRVIRESDKKCVECERIQ